MNTIAKEIMVNFKDYNDALAEAAKRSMDSEQNFENELTTFTFEDDSMLVFDGVASAVIERTGEF